MTNERDRNRNRPIGVGAAAEELGPTSAEANAEVATAELASREINETPSFDKYPELAGLGDAELRSSIIYGLGDALPRVLHDKGIKTRKNDLPNVIYDNALGMAWERATSAPAIRTLSRAQLDTVYRVLNDALEGDVEHFGGLVARSEAMRNT